MASTPSAPLTRSLLTRHAPSSTSQASFFVSGALGGAASLPVELVWISIVQKSSIKFPSFLRSTALATILKCGTRFWSFDIVRSQLQPYQHIPVWIKGGLGGAVGGFNEVLLHSLLTQRTIPRWQALGSQSLKLFFCFGTYTFLSTTLSPQQLPPKPFPWCWIMGATAGAFGSGIVAVLEGTRGSALWKCAVPRGALTIGTVIFVHVISCAALLRALGEE